jgi:hypothetical protein
MTKHIPAIVLAIISTVLAIGLYQSNRKIAGLEGKIAELESAPMPRVVEGAFPTKSPGRKGGESSPRAFVVRGGVQPEEESAGDEEKSARRRMMSSLSKMLDNPAMNKVMVASQRGALQALYGDLVEAFEFTGEEGDYFMDLLMSRQMKQVDFGMKLMGGEMSDKERTKMGEELKEVGETVNTDLHDSQNMDLRAERFSKENLRKFSEDMDRLNRGMTGKAKDLLTAEQLSAFEASVKAMAEMQNSQMEMAANMFRGGEKEE